MKSSILNMWVMASVCAITMSVASCDGNEADVEGDIPDNTPANVFTRDDKTYDIKSVVRNATSSVVEFYLSVTQGISTVNEIISSEDYVVLKADPKKEGSTDTFTKDGSYIGYNGLKFGYGDKGMAYIKFSYGSENEVSLDFKAENLYDGAKASGGISGTYTGAFSDHVRLERLELSADSYILLQGKTVKVTAVCEPEDYFPGNLEWSVENDTETSVTLTQDPEDACSYNLSCEGKVDEGEVSVIVKDKYSDVGNKIVVNVLLFDPEQPEPEYNKIVLSEARLYRKLGDEPVKLTATCYYDDSEVNSDGIRLQWSSDDENVAVVDNEGIVRFTGTGTAIIKVAKPANTTVSATCTVNVAKADAYVERIILYPDYKSLKPGEVFNLSYEVSPENAVDRDDISFVSENDGIASVTSENGEVVITAVKLGKTRIKASSVNVDVYCTVDVTGDGLPSERIPVESVLLKTDGNATGLPQFEKLQINPYYSPNGAVPTDTEWISTDPSVAIVDENGLVTAVCQDYNLDIEPKTVTIIHKADGKEASMALSIVRALPKRVVMTAYPEGGKMYLGDSFTFEAKVEPAQAPQKIAWSCWKNGEWLFGAMGSNSGLFNAFGQYITLGTYGICATCENYGDIKTFMDIEVIPVEIESASLNETDIEMQVGQESVLTVTFIPSNATYRNVEWSSSAPEVVSVDAGRIAALSEGNAVITAKLSNGLELGCSVTVKPSIGPEVGDWFYSDGTYSSSLEPGKSVAGVVFSINDATLQDPVLKRDYPSCTHGLVIGLSEWKDIWMSELKNISTWATGNGFSTLVGYQLNNNTPVVSDEGRKLRGYNNSLAIMSYPLDGDAVRLTDGLPEGTAASGSSCWYVPSIGEYLELAKNISLINGNLEKAGGVPLNEDYWSSSESTTSSNAGSIKFPSGIATGNQPKGYTKSIRCIFAF